MDRIEVGQLALKHGWGWVCENVILTDDHIEGNFDDLLGKNLDILIDRNLLSDYIIMRFYEDFTTEQLKKIEYKNPNYFSPDRNFDI